MRLLVSISLIAFSLNAFAAPSTSTTPTAKTPATAEKSKAAQSTAAKLTYDLKMNLSIDGKAIATPHAVIAAGETASITQETANGETLFMDITATEEKSSAAAPSVKLEFLVGKVADNGERIIISSPQITALENEEAEITSVDEKQSFARVSVTATRAKL